MGVGLPPLKTLRIFEAAGTRLSFKLAAEELHLTPSAISHGVRTLEEWLGAELFHRSPRGLELTAAGEAYLPEVTAALRLLRNATERVPGRKSNGSLSVSVAPTFAVRWLMPRLAKFTRLHPDLAITIDTSRHHVELPLENVDLAIRMAAQARAESTWIELMREELMPVCSPALLTKVDKGSPSDLIRQAPLIHVTTVSQDWAAWLEAAALSAPDMQKAVRVDTIQMAIEAAVEGLGVALGRRPLVDNELATGALVAAHPTSVQGATSYWLVGRPETFQRPAARQFRTWILRELAVGTPKPPPRSLS